MTEPKQEVQTEKQPGDKLLKDREGKTKQNEKPNQGDHIEKFNCKQQLQYNLVFLEQDVALN